MQEQILPAAGIHSIPATRPALLIAYGHMRGFDRAASMISEPDWPFDVASDAMIDWSIRYVGAALERIRPALLPEYQGALDDLQMAADVLSHATRNTAVLMEMGTVAGVVAVRAIVLTARAGAVDQRQAALAMVRGQREEAAIRWAAEWGQLLRDYPWLRSRHRWPAFTVSDLSAPDVFFRVDTNRLEDPPSVRR